MRDSCRFLAATKGDTTFANTAFMRVESSPTMVVKVEPVLVTDKMRQAQWSRLPASQACADAGAVTGSPASFLNATRRRIRR
jgi:hypothetical protein